MITIKQLKDAIAAIPDDHIVQLAVGMNKIEVDIWPDGLAWNPVAKTLSIEAPDWSDDE